MSAVPTSAGPDLRLVPQARKRRKEALETIAGRVEHFREVLTRQELAPKTVHQYAREVTNAENWCADAGYTLRNVPAVVFAQYVEARPKTYPSRLLLRVTVSHYWRIFKRKEPPTWIIRLPKRPRMVCRALTEEDAITLASSARARGDRQGLAVLIAMYQGFRREEVSAVRWDDLTDDGWIKVVGKGNQPAKIPLHPVVAEALAAFPRTDPVWVFPGRCLRNGHRPPVSPTTVWAWVLEVAGDAGVENVTTHRLRHTCLATANDTTGDLRAVRDYARHVKVDTTVGYTRTTERRLYAVMASIRYEATPSEEPAVSARRILAAARALEGVARDSEDRALLAAVAVAAEKAVTMACRPSAPVNPNDPTEPTHPRKCGCQPCRKERAKRERERVALLQRRPELLED